VDQAKRIHHPQKDMSEYRRLYQQGGSYFFTLVTHQRIKMFSLSDNITRLKSAFDKVMKGTPLSWKHL